MNKVELHKQRAKLLKESGFIDLEPCDDQLSRRGTSVVPEIDPVRFEESAEFYRLAGQVVNDPDTKYPSTLTKEFAGYIAQGFGRVEISREMGSRWKDGYWRQLEQANCWLRNAIRGRGNRKMTTRRLINSMLDKFSPTELTEFAATLAERTP